MTFIETRGNDNIKDKEVKFSHAILNPIASYGGLYVPKELPKIHSNFIKNHENVNYKTLATSILKLFKIDVLEKEINEALNLYDLFDDHTNPSPIVKIKENLFVNEQYHGPTRAFKDMALQPFGSILSSMAKQRNEKYLILAATSGDTGPAAIQTFKNKENISIVCLYPNGGISDVQRLQMITQNASNVKVIGINGTFDDAQYSLKKLLNSNTFKEKLKKKKTNLSAANSVNFGRIIFQIVYHFWSYIQLVKQQIIENNDKICLIIPSGNFGNALGAYYAKKMGLPIEKILIASNENNILTSWINDGIYDLNDKKIVLTSSPAMDILKSSNIERIMFDMFGYKRTKELMNSLENTNCFKLTKEETLKLQETFGATFSDDKYGAKIIHDYAKDGYLMDPHTATCIKAYEELQAQNLVAVMYSTAEWTKFSPAVLNALNKDNIKYKDELALEEISIKYNVPISKQIQKVFSRDIIHDRIIDKDNIEKEIIKFI